MTHRLGTRPILILCAGGHGRVLLDVLRARRLTPIGLLDDKTTLHGQNMGGVAVLGGETVLANHAPGSVHLINAMGNVPTAQGPGLDTRMEFFTRLSERGYLFPPVVAASAIIAGDAAIGEGAQVLTGAIVNSGARIGFNALINTGAIIEHDVQIAAHTHVAPGATLCGGVQVGEACHIGAGSVIVQGVSIGDGAVVAAGSVVTRSVKAGKVVRGVPAG